MGNSKSSNNQAVELNQPAQSQQALPQAALLNSHEIYHLMKSPTIAQLPNLDIGTRIKLVLETNQYEDLNRFIKKRKCLNECNIALAYFFHIVQALGILTTTIATGYNYPEYIWLGIGLNILASVLNIFEKTNDSMSKKMLKDIQAIKDGKYIGESELIDIEKSLGHPHTIQTLSTPEMKVPNRYKQPIPEPDLHDTI